MSNAPATTTTNYTYNCTNEGSGGCTCAGHTISNGIKVSDSVYTFDTTAQDSDCTYKLEGTTPANLIDLDEGSALVDPKYATFQGAAPLKVTGAVGMSLNTILVMLSKDVCTTTVTTTSNYSLSAALGTVTSAVRYDSISGDAANDSNKILVTHSTNQGVGQYTAVVGTGMQESDCATAISSLALNRTASFAGFGGIVDDIGDGEIFNDPFSDGSSFAFAFEHGGKIWLGPNDNNTGVVRLDADGSNPTLVSLSILTAQAPGTFTGFGLNLLRPGTVASAGGTARRYTLTPGTDLSKFTNGTAKFYVTDCTSATNNIGTAVTTTTINDAGDYVEGDSGVAPDTGVPGGCNVRLYSQDGPATNRMDGVDSFVKARVGGQDYLMFGAHNEGGAGFNELYFTQDQDDLLNLSYCNISTITLGNEISLQTIYGDGTRLFIGFAASSNAPKLGYLTGLTNAASPCTGLTNQIISAPGNAANRLPTIGGSAGNGSTYIGIDTIVEFNDGTNRLYAANNGGVTYTATIPPILTTAWTNAFTDGTTMGGATTFSGTTQSIPSTNKLRPGEKGIPFMVPFTNSTPTTHLYMARNKTDNTAELWRCSSTCSTATNWNKILDTAETGNANNTDISMVTVSKNYLYVGFDNNTDGAEVYRSTNGDAFTKVGNSGFGGSAASRLKNKQILSNAQVLYNGKYYLYITIGCVSDFSDQGACDRNGTVGETNFAIKVFRQVD